MAWSVFSFVSFGLSFVSFALLPFLAFSFVTLVALPGTKRVEVPVVVLLLEGKDTELVDLCDLSRFPADSGST